MIVTFTFESVQDDRQFKDVVGLEAGDGGAVVKQVQDHGIDEIRIREYDEMAVESQPHTEDK